MTWETSALIERAELARAEAIWVCHDTDQAVQQSRSLRAEARCLRGDSVAQDARPATAGRSGGRLFGEGRGIGVGPVIPTDGGDIMDIVPARVEDWLDRGGDDDTRVVDSHRTSEESLHGV
jgi:hypothetical protein